MSVTFNFQGKTALVTGGASGIGEACVLAFARGGANVVVADLNHELGATVVAAAKQTGGDAQFVRADVGDPSSVEQMVDATLQAFGRLDCAVNNAGIGGEQNPTGDYSVEGWQKVININLNGVFYFCRAATRQMRTQGAGRIVNIASIAGKEGNPNASHYSSSKAGVIGLTKSLGKELATQGILVTAIAPAVIETDILKEVGPEHVAYMKAKIPMDRFGKPEEVARLVGFLASEHLSFSTGAIYDISGGRATY